VPKEREVGIRCRDYEGRERIEKRTDSESDRFESAEIYDPVKELEFIMIGGSQAIVFSSAPDDFSAHTFSLDDGSAIVLPDAARQERIGRYLGENEIEEMMCVGYSVVDEGKYTLEYWISTELQEILQITILTESKRSEYRVFDIRRTNPDKSIFSLPERSQRHLICL